MMTKRALLSAMTILCACVVGPQEFGATAESGDTSAEESGDGGECTNDCAISLEWELPLLGAPLKGAVENTGTILYVERDVDAVHWLTRVAGDGNDREVFGDITPLALLFTACGELIVTTEVQGGGYRMQRFVDAEPDPTWMTTTTAHEGGWPTQMGCVDDGTIRIVGNDALDDAPTIYLDVIDAGELLATWSRPFAAFVDDVALLGEATPASADDDILVWAYSNDYVSDVSTVEIVRLSPDLVELDTMHLELGNDFALPPVPSGDGWLLAGRGDSGPWLQRLDASFAPQGARIVDATTPNGVVSRVHGLADGGLALTISNDGDPMHPQLRRYDAVGTFVAMAPLDALAEHAEGTTISGLLRDGDDLVVLGIDVTPDEDSVNHILTGWLRRYAFD